MYTCFASIVSITKVNVIELYLHCSNRLNDAIHVHTVLRCFKDGSTQSIPMCHGITLRNIQVKHQSLSMNVVRV